MAFTQVWGSSKHVDNVAESQPCPYYAVLEIELWLKFCVLSTLAD